MLSTEDDRDLVRRCLQGDEQAWLIVTDLINRLIGALAATHDLPADARKDLAQDILAALLHDHARAFRQFDGRSQLATYLGTITLRIAWHWRQANAPSSLLASPSAEELKGEEANGLAQAELWLAVQQTLSPADALICRLDAAGYTAGEIADMLSRLEGHPWREETVRQRKARALRRLRRELPR